MPGIKSLLLITLASASLVYSFGLQNQRVSSGLKTLHKAPGFPASTTLLRQSEGETVVAAKEEPKKGFLSKLWNDQTQLFTYLSVWYLGNIYCKY
jgi:hypothetical protein